VVTVHDLSFITRPGAHKFFNRLYLAVMTLWSCRRAARVIAVSEWTKRDVVNLLKVEPELVEVIPHGVHPRFRRLPDEDIVAFKRAKSIPDRCIFFLGSLEPRKNLVTLIEAFAALSTERPALSTQLIVGGAPGWKYEPIYERVKALGIQDQVRFEGQIAHDVLPLWYNACAAFAYPSLYEGFGMPVLEAMACGAPVVASTATSLPEVVGDAGLLVAPTDAAGLAQALGRVLDDEALRADLGRRARERAAQFTWRRTAEMTMETYRRAMQS
jgi:glycosyltransferase involved in cell wall biosynthesis